VPVRLAIGPRDVKNDNVEVARRDTKEKTIVPQDGIARRIQAMLDDIQTSLYDRALKHQTERTTDVDDYDTFQKVLEDKGGFIRAPWDGTPDTEQRIQDETGATIRCIPLDQEDEAGEDMLTGDPSTGRVLFAKAY